MNIFQRIIFASKVTRVLFKIIWFKLKNFKELGYALYIPLKGLHPNTDDDESFIVLIKNTKKKLFEIPDDVTGIVIASPEIDLTKYKMPKNLKYMHFECENNSFQEMKYDGKIHIIFKDSLDENLILHEFVEAISLTSINQPINNLPLHIKKICLPVYLENNKKVNEYLEKSKLPFGCEIQFNSKF